ncbi:MAG TPA: hypothetical protein PKN04_01400 [bacterium]|jgi:hypothetical protein|nr:hypothetical protein [bacterium]HOX84737.1 hypothetical protein [bacterium]HPG45460.1 hypothetical protein [bacterium]
MKMIKTLSSLLNPIKTRLKRTQTAEEQFNIHLPATKTFDGRKSEIKIDHLNLTQISLLGHSKGGRISWQGRIGDRKVKVWQLFSIDQAKFVEFVCAQPAFSDFFPQIIAQIDDYLVVDWINGADLFKTKQYARQDIIDLVAKMQVAFHRFAVPEEFANSGFDYIEHLTDRLHRFLGPIKIPPAVARLIDFVKETPLSSRPKLSHADVTPKNIIPDSTSGRLKLIDNEFLTCNRCCLVDIFNTYRSIRHNQETARSYLAAYQENGGDLQPILANRQFYLALWGLRIVVTTIQGGDIKGAFSLADGMLANQFKTHPLIDDITALVK